MLINAINDPLLGQLSDSTDRDKWGSRRLIYIKYGGPIWAFTFLLIWFPWSYTNQFTIFLHYTLSICLFDTFLTLVVMVWMALLPEMTMDTDERNKANFLSLIFGVVAVAPFLGLTAELKTTSESFRVLMIVIAILSMVCLLLVSAWCEERPEFQRDQTFNLSTSIKETIKLKSFQVFIAYNFCNVFLINLGISYLFVYSLVLTGDSSTSILGFLVIYLIVGYGSQFLCIKLRPKWGMRKVILRFGILKVIGTSLFFVIMLAPGFEWMIWIAFMWLTFFGGYGVFTTGGLMYLSVDEDEIKHGFRREGMFLGINALFTKPANSLAPILATFILVSFGYVQGSNFQTPLALHGIKILFLLVPTMVSAVGLLAFYFYPLHGERLTQLKDKLKILHEKKKKKAQAP